MIASRREVNEIKARALDELVVKTKPPEVGSVEPVKAGASNQPACHVKVLDTWPCVHGGHVVRFELTADPTKPRIRKRSDKPRLLKPGPFGGTTSNPDLALPVADPALDRDETSGVPHPFLSQAELEMVPVEVEREFSAQGKRVMGLRERHQRQMWADLEARADKLRELERLVADKHVDVSGDLRLIDRAMRSIERKLHGGQEAA